MQREHELEVRRETDEERHLGRAGVGEDRRQPAPPQDVERGVADRHRSREPISQPHADQSQSSSSATPSTTASGRLRARARRRGRRAADPAADEDRARAAEPAERDVHAEVVADHGQLARSAAPSRSLIVLERRPRRLADDRRPRAGRLRDRGRGHRAAAEDRAVRARVGGRVARRQEPRAGEHRPRGPLELRRSRPRRRARRRRPPASSPSAIGTPRLARGTSRAALVGEQQHRRRPGGAPQVGLDAAQRRQQLVVGDVEPGRAQAGGEGLGRRVAAVREEGERPAGGADPLEHLDARPAGRAAPSPARWTSVPSTSRTKPADVVKSHGATRPGRRPSARAGA